MGQDYCELQFASDPTLVRQMVQCLLEFVEGMHKKLTVEERGDLKLVFSELLFNAVNHGNKGDKRKYVHVRIRSGKGFVSVRIKDEGIGFNYAQVLERARSADALLCEDGRGMILAAALTDFLSYSKTGNQLKFIKKVAHG